MSSSHFRVKLANIIIPLILLLPLCFINSCASVPKESVELSYTIGNDLEALHLSYIELINQYFDSLKKEINRSIDTVFVPSYIEDYVKTGQLIQHAQSERADLVESWARIAVETIDKERTIRLMPINEAEEELLKSVNEAFAKVIRANATITAHLNSIRKVEQVQDEILESLKLKDIRDKINDALAEASMKANRITEDIETESSKLKNQSGQSYSD